MIIHKLVMSPHGKQFEEFPLPKNAIILSFQVFRGNLTFWYQFEESQKETQVRTFVYVRTGQPCHYKGEKYLATVQLGDLVLHIYDANRIDPEHFSLL